MFIELNNLRCLSTTESYKCVTENQRFFEKFFDLLKGEDDNRKPVRIITVHCNDLWRHFQRHETRKKRHTHTLGRVNYR